MPDTVLAKPEPQAFDALMRAQGEALHAKDQAPKTRAETDLKKVFTFPIPFPPTRHRQMNSPSL